jgi:hypothetical protein
MGIRSDTKVTRVAAVTCVVIATVITLALVTAGIIVVVSTMPVQTAHSHKGFRK